jgi:hypothetical protein
VTLTPQEGPLRGLPTGMGAIEFSLGDETKSDPCQTADVVMAWETLSGLNLGQWMERLFEHEPAAAGMLFSTDIQAHWTSQHFQEQYAWLFLEQMQREGELTLKVFGTTKGKRINDKVYSLHSWRRAGHSRMSCSP